MKPLTIKLNEHFNRSISTRFAVRNIFNFNKSEVEEVIIDFSKIHIISSSASHQFILESRELEKKNIQVSFTNTTKDIEKMLELAKTDRKNIFTVQNLKYVNVSSNEDITSILLEM